jgi:hypothetical protein
MCERAAQLICPSGTSHKNPVKALAQKYLSSVFQKIMYMIPLSRLDEEGRTRRHDRGAGCDGRARHRLDE